MLAVLRFTGGEICNKRKAIVKMVTSRVKNKVLPSAGQTSAFDGFHIGTHHDILNWYNFPTEFSFYPSIFYGGVQEPARITAPEFWTV